MRRFGLVCYVEMIPHIQSLSPKKMMPRRLALLNTGETILMAIPAQLVYKGENRIVHFFDTFVMPLLIQLGFGIVVNYHGQREFGRDVIFGDIDRFGHVVYLWNADQVRGKHFTQRFAFVNTECRKAHTIHSSILKLGVKFISCFYVANAGDISEPARDNFFSIVARRGIRDARLLDGNLYYCWTKQHL